MNFHRLRNTRFLTNDPFKNAPKTTKWRLRKRQRKSETMDDIDDDASTSTGADTCISVAQDKESIIPDKLWYEDENDSEEENWFEFTEDTENSMWYDCVSNSSSQDTNEDAPNVQSDHKTNRPIYEGADLTVEDSNILLLTFALKHNLTGECLSDLLQLISLHCKTPNLLSTSLFKFRGYFADIKMPLTCHRYCTSCTLPVDKNTTICSNCSSRCTSEEGTSFFVEIPIKHQLEELFKRQEFHQTILHRFSRKKVVDSHIEDIYDGLLYRENFGEREFLANGNNISFMWYTDGIPLFKSSKISLWLLLFAINELPYKERCKPENLIFAGLWFGKTKPSMGCFLKPFYDALLDLKTNGVHVYCNHCKDTILCKVLLLCGTCDLPAKCILMNMMQFNGQYGCPICKQEGEVVKKVKGHTQVFPFNQTSFNGPKRTHEEFITLGESAHRDSSSNTYGVKGPSWLANASFDIIRGTAIDYMHTVLLGIVRRLLKLWFDPLYSKESFSISNLVSVADKRLSSIKPPYFIKRHIRSITQHGQYWKASEYRSWLFYYSAPVLKGLLQPQYFNHFLLLVEAIYILNLQSISQTHLGYCEELLMKFHYLYDALYGRNNLSGNLHQLLHITDVVRNLGPLWVYSCFSFESFNGKLLKLLHGTQNPAVQICNPISTLMKLPRIGEKLDSETRTGQFYQQLLDKQSLSTISENITCDLAIIGGLYIKSANEDFIELLTSFLHAYPARTYIFHRLLYKDTVYYSKEYRVKSRNSYTIQFNSNNDIAFGEIKFFVKAYKSCLCPLTACPCKASYLCIVRKFVADENNTLCNELDDSPVNAKLSHIVSGSFSEEIMAIDVSDIIKLCICIEFERVEKKHAFIAIKPNRQECE